MVMAAMVWYVPGWMRTQSPQEGALEAVSNAFPEASVQFKSWDGDNLLWSLAVDTADREAWRLAFEIATMPEAERKELTLVGHSLGGRMTARVLAHLAAKKLKVRQAVLMAAAIPYDDPDLVAMGGATELPIVSICNPDDVTLRYVYKILGGEKSAAYGANGTLSPVDNVVECVTPSNITERVSLDDAWAKSKTLKEIANHHVLFYLGFLKGLRDGENPSGAVMVPQDYVTVETKVVDAGIWWDDVESAGGWKLERHKVAKLCRIVSPARTCTAWGGEAAMRAAFAKVKSQL
jgi:pimeloyl-ACP methyl ester carboxylesterase